LQDLTRPKVERWIAGETFDLFVGSHDAYSRLEFPVVHRRWIFSLKSGFFLVRDLAQGVGKHRLDITWHLGPEMRMRAEYLFGVKGASAGLALLSANRHGWAQEVRKDMWSPVYGKKEPITVLNFGTVADLPSEFVTLLIPLEEIRGTPGKLMQIKVGGDMPVKGYHYRTPAEECFFFFAAIGEPWIHERLASDAEFVCWQRKRDGESELLILCNGSYVEIDGRRVLGCKQTVSRCEMVIRDGRKEIHASEPEALLEE